MKKFATFLPKNWLAETPQPLCFDAAWQTVGGNELISEIIWNIFLGFKA
ncbi:hypothetical protein ACPOM7_26250 [Peribacillus castrilensis]|nr:MULTISPECIES: hypothetical protein [Bacillaceae]MCP1095493.1 hypothetical protein [Bacillaceae bacterium OS4b]MCF7622648.1 hypothetical protein [Peribacillus frigoritolerans]MCP1153193.1 hypothetical protein [Peribacillus frigoritolerans]MCT1390790.1 hypothetical protein [Peribacillus frigoritolerans]NCT38211.1 hypothetical protein [Peribacillus frigoritolerans]